MSQKISPLSCLPVEHPDYKYTVSRNPYWEKLKNHQYILADNDTESLLGKWQSKTKLPLCVELGCNGGHFLLKIAEATPDRFFIGVDWKIKQIFFAGEKAKKLGLKNIIFLKAHMDRLQFIFDNQEIDELLLYFPDPWEKKSQRKHRFFQTSKIQKIAPLIKKGGQFHIKTDHDDYFEQMCEVSRELNPIFNIIEETRDKHAGNPDQSKLEIPDITLFEKVFIAKNIKIKSLKLQKL